MKVALVHDYLNTKLGGAERILLELAAMYPDAPIYTTIHNRNLYDEVLDPRRVQTSFLQRFPKWLQNRHRYLLPLLPTAIEQFDLSDYDVVISSSSAFAKAVITKPETLHVCYCHTPMRFVWDYWPRYVNEQGVGPVRRAAIHRLTSRLRVWDFYSAARVDKWVANSQTTAKRIQKYYRQTAAATVFPGVDLDAFSINEHKDGDYFVTFGSLTPYKKYDLAIQACNQLNQKLIVMGDGLDRSRLEAMAGPTVTFVGAIDDAERARLLAGAKGLIFAGIEDFGIVIVEAMASGIPVIAYNEGGATETVVDGKTGVLFNAQTTQSVVQALERFETKQFDPKAIRQHAEGFDRAAFRKQVSELITKWQREHVNAN